MRPSRSSQRLIAVVLSGLCCAAAQEGAAQAPAEGGAFLLIPVGARAAALGQAAITDAGSSEAVFWNPAGLAALRRTELAVHHYTSFAGPGDAVVFAVPSPALGTFAAGAYILDYGDFDVTPRDPGSGGPIGRASVRNIALSLTYATDVVGGFAAGIGYKLVQFRVDCSGDCTDVPTATGTTHSVDVGLRFAARRLVVAAAVRNIGFKLQVNNQAQADPLPARLQTGVSWQARRPPARGDGFDVRLAADLRAQLDASHPAVETLVGLDAGVRDLVRLRGGYAFLDSEARGPSIGIGLKYSSFAFDLARIFFATDEIGEAEPVHFSLRLFF